MHCEAMRVSKHAHLIDEPRLADARVAAHIDDVSGSLFDARAHDATKLLQFRLAPDEPAAARTRGFAHHAGEAPRARGHVYALEVHLAHLLADRAVAERAPHTVGQQRLS